MGIFSKNPRISFPVNMSPKVSCFLPSFPFLGAEVGKFRCWRQESFDIAQLVFDRLLPGGRSDF